MKVFYASWKTLRFFAAGLLIVCALFAVVSMCADQQGPQPELLAKGNLDPMVARASRGLTQYNISVYFDPVEKELHCQQLINYINEDDTQFKELYFHLYPNAFKYEDKPVFEPDEMPRAYPNGFSPGAIDIKEVAVNGNQVPFSVGGYSEDIMRVDLREPLKPRQKAAVSIKYTVTIPNCVGRFGYGENTYNITNWYPIACVYDDEGWNLDPYYPVGDPFYSDTANYKVTITTPKDYILATTGDIVKIDEKEGNKTWTVQALAVRDFAWIASSKFSVSSREVDGTVVYSYYYTSGPGLKALDYAANAIRVFNRMFGKYPYRQFSVVQTDFFIGGMEYPNMVMVDQSLYREETRNWLEIITVHEAAHQWWYAMVGNDEIDEAWLDEALTEYSTVLYYGQQYGKEKESEMYNELVSKGKYGLLKIFTQGEDIDETIDRPTYEFDDWIIYDTLVYGKGAMMFHEIRQRVGDDKFFEILREYFKSNLFSNATREDLINACEAVTGEEWDDFFQEWLYDQ